MFLDNGYTKEEWKVVTESRKILHLPELRVSCTAVRVPVFVSHSEAVHVETREPITPAEARALFAGGHGRRGPGRPGRQRVPARAESAAGSDDVFVGRVRQDLSIDGNRGLAFWVVSDNLRKGAASNAVEIAEALVERGWVRQGERACVEPVAEPRVAADGNRSGRPGDGPRDARRAPGGARSHRHRGPGLHPVPAARRPDAGRSRARATPTPRSCSWARARA